MLLQLDTDECWRAIVANVVAESLTRGEPLILSAAVGVAPASGSIHMMAGHQLGLEEIERRAAESALAAAVAQVPTNVRCSTRLDVGRPATALLKSALSGRHSTVFTISNRRFTRISWLLLGWFTRLYPGACRVRVLADQRRSGPAQLTEGAA